jgi:hypothetical protein
MTASEITEVTQRLRRRIEAVLTPAQLACYDAYQARIAQQIERRDPAPVPMGADERAVFDLIASDREAAALRKQLDYLTRVATPPQ